VAQHKRTRPRGFIEDWNPRQQTLQLVESVQAILDDNSDILPLTLRQIFYMLVSRIGYEKTERDYQRLCETMNKARRARLISMFDIRDDGLRRENPHGWDSEESIIDVFKSYSTRFRLKRQEDQPVHLMVWCEAGGMLPQLARYCEEYGVSVLSSGGFDSVTSKHNLAAEVAQHNEVEILHIGDHDPSGVHIHNSLDEDLKAFVSHYGGRINVTRLAVTPDQVAEMGLPTAPAKRTDNRAFEGLTTQAEAIPPKALRQIVRDAISDRIDWDIFNDVLAREEDIRASLSGKLELL
jgi:hypothetical protein